MAIVSKSPSFRLIHLVMLLNYTCLAALICGCTAGNTSRAAECDNRILIPEGDMPVLPAAAGPLETTYVVEGRQIQLHQGKAAQPAAPGAATLIETRVFGRPEYGDLNGDGLDDAVVFLRHDPGGSGTFYYVAAALFNGSGWQGTQAVLLGDRIVPRSIEIRNGVIIVNYLGRGPNGPLSAPATVEMSRTLTVEDNQLTDAAQRPGPGYSF